MPTTGSYHQLHIFCIFLHIFAYFFLLSMQRLNAPEARNQSVDFGPFPTGLTHPKKLKIFLQPKIVGTDSLG